MKSFNHGVALSVARRNTVLIFNLFAIAAWAGAVPIAIGMQSVPGENLPGFLLGHAMA